MDFIRRLQPLTMSFLSSTRVGGNSIVGSAAGAPTPEVVRYSLIRQEDTIVFCLIERARFLHNARTYQEGYAQFHGCSGSLIEFFVKETEAIQAKPLLVSSGDDGNYVSTAAGDLACLQALSRRIHHGKFVAEDRDALMKQLTSKPVEEMVKEKSREKGYGFWPRCKALTAEKERRDSIRLSRAMQSSTLDLVCLRNLTV